MRGNGVHAVEGAGEDEVVVGGQLGKTGVELAVVNQTTGFGDDHEGEDDPRCVSYRLQL